VYATVVSLLDRPVYGFRQVFVGSGAAAAGGLGLTAPTREAVPAQTFALLGAATELAAFERMEHRIGMVAEPYSMGTGGRYVKAGKLLSLAGTAGALLSRHSRIGAAACGAALIAGSLATRWGIFHAGTTSSNDPKYTVVPQCDRLQHRSPS
jgi:hypothetical protein